MRSRDAYVLRETTGTSGVIETARAAVAVLADHDIPHLIAGGIAVQEYGYPRVTIDADIVVPDVVELIVRRKLARDLAVAQPVQTLYFELWDQLKKE